MKSREEMLANSIKTRKARADARREKVKALREKGYAGPQIAAELNIKLRTVYHDFAILNKADAEN